MVTVVEAANTGRASEIGGDMLTIRAGSRFAGRALQRLAREYLHVQPIRARIRLDVRRVIHSRHEERRHHLVHGVGGMERAVSREPHDDIGLVPPGNRVEPGKYVIQVSPKNLNRRRIQPRRQLIIARVGGRGHDERVERPAAPQLSHQPLDHRGRADRRQHLVGQPGRRGPGLYHSDNPRHACSLPIGPAYHERGSSAPERTVTGDRSRTSLAKASTTSLAIVRARGMTPSCSGESTPTTRRSSGRHARSMTASSMTAGGSPTVRAACPTAAARANAVMSPPPRGSTLVSTCDSAAWPRLVIHAPRRTGASPYASAVSNTRIPRSHAESRTASAASRANGRSCRRRPYGRPS